MVQAEIKEAEPKKCVDVDLIVLDELPVSVDLKPNAEEKHNKREISKLIQKTKYNAKMHEELVSIKRVRSQFNYRNYGVY